MLQEEHHEDFWFVAVALLFSEGKFGKSHFSSVPGLPPSGHAGWPGLQGEGNGTAALC